MMNWMKIKPSIIVFVIAVTLLNLPILPTEAQGTSIEFKDMYIQLDNVDNYSGVRIIVLFWDGCYSCKEEVDTFKQIDQSYNVTIFFLNVVQASTNDSNEGFIEETEAPSSWIFGYLTLASEEQLNITYVPVIIILDDEGYIAADIQGPASYNFIETCLVNAIEKNTEEYFTERREDPGDYTAVIFIVVGVIISAVVIYFLVKSFTMRKKQGKNVVTDIIDNEGS